MIKTMWRFCWIPEKSFHKNNFNWKNKTAEPLTLIYKNIDRTENSFCVSDTTSFTSYLPLNWTVIVSWWLFGWLTVTVIIYVAIDLIRHNFRDMISCLQPTVLHSREAEEQKQIKSKKRTDLEGKFHLSNRFSVRREMIHNLYFIQICWKCWNSEDEKKFELWS